MRKTSIKPFKSHYFCDFCGDHISKESDNIWEDKNRKVELIIPHIKEKGFNGRNRHACLKCYKEKIEPILLKLVIHNCGYIIGFENDEGKEIRKFEPSIFYEPEEEMENKK